MFSKINEKSGYISFILTTTIVRSFAIRKIIMTTNIRNLDILLQSSLTLMVCLKKVHWPYS